MTLNRYFGWSRPLRTHVLRGHGISREVATLYKNLNTAFDSVEAHVLESGNAATIWVDTATSIGIEDQNGSAVRPFSSVTAAIASALERNLGAVFFMILPSFAYATEDPLTIPGGKVFLFESSLRYTAFPSVIWTPTGSFSNDPLTASILFLRGLQVVGPITIAGDPPLLAVYASVSRVG